MNILRSWPSAHLRSFAKRNFLSETLFMPVLGFTDVNLYSYFPSFEDSKSSDFVGFFNKGLITLPIPKTNPVIFKATV